MGYGIVEGEDESDGLNMVGYGVLTCSNRAAISARLHLLYEGLMGLIGRYQPDEVAIEEPFVAKNARSALAIGQAQAVAILAATSNKAPVYTYTPTQVKRAVADYGGSGKEQVQRMVQLQLGLDEVPTRK